MKKLLLITATIALSVTAYAQSFNLSKLTFGGGFGMQFGDYTMINISPQVGYDFTKMFNAGAGISYSYSSQDWRSSAGEKWKERRNYGGFNIYGRLHPTSFLVLMAQPEINRVWLTEKNTHTGQKYSTDKFAPAILIGGGVRLGPMTAMLKYDVLQDKYSPYSNDLFYSIGYTFGF